MSSSPSSSSVSSIPKLDGTNYATWSFALQAIFSLHGLDEIVSGVDTKPTLSTPPTTDESKALTDWTRRSKQVGSLIVLTIKESLYHLINASTDGKDIWDILKTTYQKPGALSVFLLYQKVFRSTLSEGSSLREQIQELTNLRQQISTAGVVISDQHFAFSILLSLPESYSTLSSTLLATIDLTTIKPTDVTARILEEESRRSLNPSLSAVKKTKRYSGTCGYCKKQGHRERECRSKKRDESKGKPSTPSTNAIVASTSSEESIPTSFYIASDANPWMLDSGCSDHMTPFRSDFIQYESIPNPRNVTLGDSKSTIQYLGIGKVKGLVEINGNRREIVIDNVLHVPKLRDRFISTRRLDQKGFATLFENSTGTILKNGKAFAVGLLRGQQYWLDIFTAPTLNANTKPLPIDIWHQRLGHLNWRALAKARSDAAPMLGISFSNAPHDEHPCDGCMKGKSHRRPFPSSSTPRATHPLDLIHSDLDGPMQTKSIAENASYIQTFIDDHSRHIWVFLLKTKDQQPQVFETFRSLVETQHERKIKVFRTDRGGEYQSNKFIARLAELGIQHQRTIPDTPQQNGLSERCNRTIVESAKSMLHTAGLSFGFWGEAVRTAVLVRNRSPTKSLDWKTPHEILTGRTPDISYFRIFGCKAYVHVLKKKRKNKMESQSSTLTFVGYEPNSKGYRFWNASTRSIVVSTDVTFDESSFPHLKNPSPPISIPVPNPTSDTIQLPLLLDLPLNSDGDSDDDTAPPPPPATPPSPGPPPRTPEHSPRPLDPPQTPVAIRTRPSNRGRGRGQQPRVPPLVIEPPLTARRSTREGRGQNQRYLGDENMWDLVRDDGSVLSPRNRHLAIDIDEPLLYAVLLPGEPATYSEAIECAQSDDWLAAMREEMDSLHKSETWELVDLPSGRSPVKCKWVFRLKFNSAGETTRYKARLVAKGFTQVFGLDFSETFSPVARLDSVRLLLALATLRDWEIHQIDVKSAFLNGDLDEEIYMRQPEGFQVPGQENKVCRLRKALYGLKQASRQWHRKLNTALRDLGFEKSAGDSSVHVMFRQGGDSITILIVYVDDITLMGDSIEQIQLIKKQLANSFELTDLGEISYYLGLRITRDRTNRTISLDQEKYIQDILSRFQMSSCTPANTPFASGTDLLASSSPAEDNDPSIVANYQSMVGSLMYAMIGSRPDISYAVSKLSQFSSNPTQQHVKAAKHVLRYLAATKHYSLHYGISDETIFFGHSDSDWAGDKNDRHSTTGYVFLLAGGATCWASRRQPTVALSSTEAEYMAVTDASKHAIWLQTIFSDIGIDSDDPTPIHVDNQGCIDLTSNPVHHKRTKHIDIRHHFIRECVEDKKVEVIKIPTGENIADALTKSLPLDKHVYFTGKMGLSA